MISVSKKLRPTKAMSTSASPGPGAGSGTSSGTRLSGGPKDLHKTALIAALPSPKSDFRPVPGLRVPAQLPARRLPVERPGKVPSSDDSIRDPPPNHARDVSPYPAAGFPQPHPVLGSSRTTTKSGEGRCACRCEIDLFKDGHVAKQAGCKDERYEEHRQDCEGQG